MKLTDFMDNKVAGDLDYVMPADACADEDVLLEHKKELHLREVNANEYYCPNSESLSPVKTPDGRDNDESDGTESVCTERRNSSPENSRENQDGESLDSTTSSSQENVTGDKSSPVVSTDELDKEISAIKAQINALDDISESEHVTDEETEDESGKTNEPDQSPERSLRQIRRSLEEKVKNLREVKHVSDEKIRMAQEEEELRIREKIKLRQQLLIHRKERLKKLISDLKRKLDCQSQRLQTGYSSLLSLQKTVFRSRSFSAKSRPPRRNDKDTVEAPF
ncbi:uncharacterized protein [Amphiura filiformis]